MVSFADLIREHRDALDTLGGLEQQIERFIVQAVNALKDGNKILLMGNGGSAADCQHFAAEIVGRFKRERRALPAIALTTDTSILTALGNDYSFEFVFVRQIEALARPGDIVVGISTSGNSVNIIKALTKARETGCFTVGLLGKGGGPMKDAVDLPIVVAWDNTPRIQECHILIIHYVCEMIEASV